MYMTSWLVAGTAGLVAFQGLADGVGGYHARTPRSVTVGEIFSMARAAARPPPATTWSWAGMTVGSVVKVPIESPLPPGLGVAGRRGFFQPLEPGFQVSS